MRIEGNELTIKMYSGETFAYKGVLGRKYINRINALYPDMQNDQPPGKELIHLPEYIGGKPR
jgi:hypothetical protein